MKRLTYFFMFLVDVILIQISVFSGYLLFYEGNLNQDYSEIYFPYSLVLSFFISFAMKISKQYFRIWKYARIRDFLSLFMCILISGCMGAIGFSLVVTSIPIMIQIFCLQTIILLLVGFRGLQKVSLTELFQTKKIKNRTLVVGAGDCGTLVVKKLKESHETPLQPIGFIDDALDKYGKKIYGLPVLGNRENIKSLVQQHQVDHIIVALPSVQKQELLKIVEICKQTEAKITVIPRIDELIHGKLSINTVKNVEVEDLLKRDIIQLDIEEIKNYLSGQIVLVTGAGGSIGSELCRQILEFSPRTLLLLGHGENSIYSIEQELRQSFPHEQIIPLIADIQDQERIELIFKSYQPNVVFHAAAHKHVPLMEANPSEAIKNNIIGTKIVADGAHKYKANKFILISTDKSVNPTSVMGASKRIAEMYIHGLSKESETIFASVRFGNVLGSRGSVIPLFKKQIASGGPITVTHPDMTRYFMTIPEAVLLVVQSGALASGGEIFILDMGEPVKIVNLAEDMIKLSGFEPYREIEIKFIGMRPGEKLFEELMLDGENNSKTTHDRIFIGNMLEINFSEFERQLERLLEVLEDEPHIIRREIKNIVPSFRIE
ncbi:FlaA1/EpsC-like NDP-sugar epimerase [Bacillus mesophilus]|uniref:Polysaccharide biosynthesis protein n=1 Tax=Bacillus mesophilus TaxID=1808955 RepID=A0A6M0QCK6_9BACI|nr:nucleoside-diphosphate sugar epimerase/dehydratase [Bacillus mesophilus]MBM7662859.1 FlaA1/EpsC-like NDP-sugar epimerase [Bacillus mesophilus]NEY73449.1 polysaccharide biosynthesis protein [Bacillus mesophilus]